MASKKQSVAGVARSLRSAERKTVKSWSGTRDSFQNFAANLGIGTDNVSSAAMYGFNPVTRIRTQLEWAHRGDWLSGVAVDTVANDMTRAGVEIKGDMEPDDINKINAAVVRMGIWNSVNETIRWARLYGGCLGVAMVDGQDYATPFRPETVLRKGQFKGVLPLDRWMVEPSLQDLVTEPGPHVGLPRYYSVTQAAPALRGKRIHYSRCVLRQIGIKLPYWQSVMENLWGISILERMWDRMLAFNSASTGAAQLVYKSYLRIYKVKNLREIVAAGGPQLRGLLNTVEFMRRFQTQEGITTIDSEDEMDEHGATGFAGLADAVRIFADQIAGALNMPLVRLFGHSPDGMNSTGESDLRMYYDGILQEQETTLHVPMATIYRCVAQSEGLKVPDGFDIAFKSLWQMQEKEKADIATTVTDTLTRAFEAGIVERSTVLQEMKQSSNVTGVWSNITEEHIKSAESDPPPVPEGVEEVEARTEGKLEEEEQEDSQQTGAAKAAKDKRRRHAAKDSNVAQLAFHHGLQVVVETAQGTVRRGHGWQTSMPADYGYVRRVPGADGDMLDCFVGPAGQSDHVFVIDQKDLKTGKFDEHKVMLGYYARESAVEDFVLSNSDGKGAQRIMNVTELRMPQFKQWMQQGDTTKPCDAAHLAATVGAAQ